MNQLAAAELQATVASLGTFDGAKYHPEPDCVECIKDLIRFIRRDDENHEVRRAIGELGVVKSDLVHIIRDHSNNRELFDVTLRLLVNLTSSEFLLFKEELPDDKETRNFYLQIQSHRQSYKQAFVDKELWTRICKYLGNLLKKDFDERLEDEKLVLERILMLIRNVLQVPSNIREEGRAEGDATLHDQLLWVLQQSGIQDLLLFIASSDMETQYCLHVLEIIRYMLRDQDPTALASANVSRSTEEKKKDDEELRRVQKIEEQKKKQKLRHLPSSRHSNFGGTYVIKNLKGVSEKDMVTHKLVGDVQNLDFDRSKKGIRKAKNKIAPDDVNQVRRSTLAVRIFLKEFCVEFLLSAYNPLMSYVKDAIVRQRSQLNDESYYLWSMKFFMEFNRAHQFKVELVTETLSKQAFHFLQQQMENYRDMFEMEKRNRPKYLMWAKRMHLAIRAYEELLLNLVHMESSKEEKVREAGRIIRAGVFYEPEYRELCLQQLSSFNPDRMSLGYLTDLVTTTHVFLKLMEHMSKNRHLLVSKKTKRKPKSGKKKDKNSAEGGGGEAAMRRTKEDQWDQVSPQVSALLQGRGSIPLDVVPFDAALETPIEEQKEQAMKKIQKCLLRQEAGQAIALLRASREVWPEGESFGPPDSVAEEDFMTLREILFADLGVDDTHADTAGGEGEEGDNDQGEIGEGEGEEEEEEEEVQEKVYSVEQEFDFKGFVARFTQKNILRPYGILFSNYEKNSKTVNHYIVKMFHRVAVDNDLPAMLFQATIFRVFQRIWQDLKLKPEDQALREMAKFAKFVLKKFMAVATTNKKVFIELLFWKSSRDAREIVEGYGTYSVTANQKKSFWSEEEEQRLVEVFMQVKEMEKDNPDVDLLDRMEEMYAHENRTRRQIGNKLRDLGIINSMREITRKPLSARRMWTEAEINKITQLYNEFKDAEHPATRIYEQWKADVNMTKRSKNKLVDKIMELGLCTDRSRLGRVKRKGRVRDPNEKEAEKSETDSAMEDSSSGEDESDEESEVDESSAAPRKDLVTSARSWLEVGDAGGSVLTWLADSISEEADDRQDEDGDEEGVPLVPLQEEQGDAVLKESFQEVLEAAGMSRPCDGEQYWRIPGDISHQALKARAHVIQSVVAGAEDPLEGVQEDLLVVHRGLNNVVEANKMKKKKKKRGKNKWQPFRRDPTVAAAASAGGDDDAGTSITPKPDKSAKKRVEKPLPSSDSEDEPEPVKEVAVKKKTPGKSGRIQINKDKIRRLLNSDSSDDSSGDDEDGANAGNNSSDSSGPEDRGFRSNKTSEKQSTNNLQSSSDEGVDDPNVASAKPIKNDEQDRDDLPAANKSSKKKAAAAKNKQKAAPKQPKKSAPKKKPAKKNLAADSSDESEAEKKPAKKKNLMADSSDDSEAETQVRGRTKNRSLLADSSEDEDVEDVGKKSSKSGRKKSAPKLTADSSDEEVESASARKPGRALLADSSNDETTLARANSSDDNTAVRAKKNAIMSSDEEGTTQTERKKSNRIDDSDESDQEKKTEKAAAPTAVSKDPAVASQAPAAASQAPAAASQDSVGRSRLEKSLMSQSFDSRLDDSRLDDSRLNDSRMDDSRLSYSRLSSSRSRSRSLSSRSRSRSLSPLSKSPASSRRSSPLSSRSVSPASSRPVSSAVVSPGSSRPASSVAAATPARLSQKTRTPLSVKNTPSSAPSSTAKRKRGDGMKAAAADSSADENSPVKPPRSKKRIAAVADDSD